MLEDHPGRIRLDPQRVVAARKLKGMSRAALVDAALPEFPISEATVKRAEKGHAINLEKARTLAALLGVALESLLPQGAAPLRAASPARPGEETGRDRAPRWTPLVGRHRELAALEAALERVISGEPQLVLLRGEAGIGKSRLIQELGRIAGERHACFALGRAHQYSGHPFQPFLEALASAPRLIEAADVPDRERLRRFAGSDSMFEGPSGPERRADHVLFRAVSQALLSVPEPTLLVLDDLQWIDRSSFELFEHLALAAADASESGRKCALLLVASYRPEDLRGRVSGALARLAHEPLCRVIEVANLDSSGTFELLTGLGVERPSEQLVSTLCDATGGNPLFVIETLRLLRMRGALFEGSGFTSTRADLGELELPETITGAIASRVQGLSAEARSALVRAAFLGVRFELAKLSAVLHSPEGDVLELLEECVAEGFLHNRDQEFEFAHPLMRHVCYQEPIPARAQRIHREIAERLDARYTPRTRAHAREIADHLIRAGPVARAERVIRYAGLAAEQAAASCAWDEEARFLQAALAVGRARGELSDREVAEYERRTGVALHRLWDVGPSLEHYDAAVAAFARAGDRVGAARTLNDRVRLADNVGQLGGVESGGFVRLEEALEALGSDEPRLRGQILDTLATCCWGARQTRRGGDLARRALALALAERDDDLCAQVSTSLALAHLEQLELQQASDRWLQGIAFARSASDRLREVRCLQRLPLPLYLLGRCDEAERVADEAWRLSGVLHNSGEASIPRSIQASLALLRGELALAERLGEETVGLLRRRRYAWAGPLVFPTLVCVRALRGDFSAAREILARVLEPGHVFDDPRRFAGPARRYGWLVDAWEQDAQERELLRSQVAGARRARPRSEELDAAALTPLCLEVELAWALALPERIGPVHEALCRARDRGVVMVTGWPCSLSRVLGQAATLLGRRSDASRHFEDAVAAAQRAGARAEEARARLDWAAMLASGGSTHDAGRSSELARRAGAIAEDVGASFLARRAQDLGACWRPATP